MRTLKSMLTGGILLAVLAALVVLAGWVILSFTHWQFMPINWPAARMFVGMAFAAGTFAGFIDALGD